MLFIANGADFSIVADSILCDGDSALGLQIASVSANGTMVLIMGTIWSNFQPLEVYPNTTTTYIALSLMRITVFQQIRLF